MRRLVSSVALMGVVVTAVVVVSNAGGSDRRDSVAASRHAGDRSIAHASIALTAASAGAPLSADQLDALALHAAAYNGDPDATGIQAVATTRALASAAIDPQEVSANNVQDHADDPVFLITMHGTFTDANDSSATDGPARQWNEISFVVDAATGELMDAAMRTDAQLQDAPLDLTQLGQPMQLPSLDAASTAVVDASQASSVTQMRQDLPSTTTASSAGG